MLQNTFSVINHHLLQQFRCKVCLVNDHKYKSPKNDSEHHLKIEGRDLKGQAKGGYTLHPNNTFVVVVMNIACTVFIIMKIGNYFIFHFEAKNYFLFAY